MLLRPSGRGTEEVIHVASISLAAWSQADLLMILAALQGRNATMIALAEELTIPPSMTAVDIQKINMAFTIACRRKTGDDPRRAGALASMAVRMARAEEGCKRIEERWKLPTKSYPTPLLLKEAKVSLPTAKKRLGARPDAQRIHLNSLETAIRNMKRSKSYAEG